MELIASWTIDPQPTENDRDGIRFLAEHPEDRTVLDIVLSGTNVVSLEIVSDLKKSTQKFQRDTRSVQLLVKDHGKALDRACRRFWLALAPETKGQKHLATLKPADGDLYLSHGHGED